MSGKNVTTLILWRNHITLPDKAHVIASQREGIRAAAYAASCLSQYVVYPTHIVSVGTASGRSAYDAARRVANMQLLTDLDNLIREDRPSLSEQRAGWMRILTLSEGRGTLKGYKLQVATNGYRHWVYLAPARDVTPHGPEEQWGAVSRYG